MTFFRAALGSVTLVALIVAAAGDQPGFIKYDEVRGAPYTVSYDKNSLKINGKPSVFLSGSIHYPRGTPAVWDVVLDEAKEDGLNAIEMYTFWDVHEPAQGQYVWSGRANVTAFLELCKQKGLFVIFRIGPYVCGEYDYGGLPVWVGQVPGIKFRTYNEQWTSLVADWMKTVVAEVRGYFADKGGPIMLAQVENEYEPRNDQDREYVKWCGEMAAAMQLTVPWIMCNGASADNTINTCNANDCVAFLEKNGQSGRILVDQPALWTENEGWFQNWGFPYPDRGTNATLGYVQSRTPEDIAYASARWFARGGTLMNYYMWYGGNHFRQPGSSIATWYANDVNLNADTLPNEPKKTHLKNMHLALAAVAESLLVSGPQINSSVPLQWFNNQTGTWEDGSGQFAFVYGQSPSRVAFIENSVDQPVLTRWEGNEFTMPPLSISIANEDGEEAWNSGKVPEAALRRVNARAHDSKLEWEMWRDPLFAYACDQPVTDHVPYEQLNLTRGFSDYAVYSTQFDWDQPAGPYNLSIDTHMSQVFVAFVDGLLVADLFDTTHSDSPLPLFALVQMPGPGPHNLTILSVSLGVDNSIVSGDPPKIKGVTGRVLLGPLDLTGSTWTMQGQLAGECLEVYTAVGGAKVNWEEPSAAPHSWYRASFDTPSRLDGAATRTALLFNATGLNRGFAYVNGQPVGRFWLIEGRAWGRDSGRPSQDVYFVPWDYLNDDGANTITIFAELPGDLSAPHFTVASLVAVDSEDSEDWEPVTAEGDDEEPVGDADEGRVQAEDELEAEEEANEGKEEPELAQLVEELAGHELEAAADEDPSKRTAEYATQQPENAAVQPDEQTRLGPAAQGPPQPQAQSQPQSQPQPRDQDQETRQEEEARPEDGSVGPESTQAQDAASPLQQPATSSQGDQNVLAVM